MVWQEMGQRVQNLLWDMCWRGENENDNEYLMEGEALSFYLER